MLQQGIPGPIREDSAAPSGEEVGGCRSFGVCFVLCLSLLCSAGAFGQIPAVSPNGVVNAAGFLPTDFPGGAIVPGSIISIFGSNLGPAIPVQASSFPLPTELGGTEVIVENQRCFLIFVSAQQVNCVLPGDLTRDRVRLFLRTRDRDQLRESVPVDVPLAAASVAIFTQNGNGRGPAAALNLRGGTGGPYDLNGPRSVARQGQVVLLFGTGLGETNPPAPAGLPSVGLAPSAAQPSVWIGGVAAQIQYAGRAPGFAGLDQIQIVIPPNAPEGCAVPVRLRIRDRIRERDNEGNVTTLAIHATQSLCGDAMEIVDGGGSHGSVVLASGLGKLGPGQQGPPTVPPGGGPGGPAGPIGYGLHPGIPPHAFGFGFQQGRGNGPDVIAARFVRFGRPDVGIPPAAPDSCNVYYQGPRANPDLFLGAAELLDAGVLTLQTPSSTAIVRPDTVAGLGVLYLRPLPEPLSFGIYSVRGAGGLDVGPFGPARLRVPTLVSVTTSLANGTVISQANPFTLSWTGGGGSDLVLIHGRAYQLGPNVNPPVAEPWSYPSMAFLCSANASANRFTIPAYILQQLPTGQFSLTVSHVPSAAGVSRFDASGLSLGGVFRWLSTVTYPNLLLGR